MKKFLSIALLSILVLVTALAGSKCQSCELSSLEQLKQSWNIYKDYFIQSDGRVIDFYAEGISTSEGQSYSLLRAVWLNDKETFDTVLKWTNNNIKKRGDNLFAWKWGKTQNINWEIIDKSSATDADQDIALALLMAYEKWDQQDYLNQATGILEDIWTKEIININGNNYLTAGDWAAKEEEVKLNPSYFAPYAYRIFAKYDTKHDWNSLVESSYSILAELSSRSALYLPPDWAYINKKTGNLSLKNESESDFSYDAIRTLWRISLDYALNKDPRAIDYLKKSTRFLIKYWQINQSLPASITIDGVIRKPEESYAIYGSSLPAIALIDENTAQQIYQKKIACEFIKGFWHNPRDYYAQNIIWFGLSTWININNKNEPLDKRGLVNLLEK